MAADAIPLLRATPAELDKAERSELIDFYAHCATMGNEWLYRQIIDNNRIDILAISVLGYEVKPFHLRMLAWQFQHPDNLQLVFRGAGKSTLCTVTKTIHLLCKDRNLRILLSSKTIGNSEAFLKEVKGHLEGNIKLVAVFGAFYDPRKVSKWDTKEIEVLGRTKHTKEASVACIGVEGTLVSKHIDVIISDDLIDEENSRTKHMRDRTQTWYYQTLDPCLEPPHPDVPHRGEHHRLGTRYHFADLYGHLEKNELKESTQTIPALDEDGCSPWPEKYPPAWFKRKRKKAGMIIFNCHADDTEFLTDEGWRLFDDVSEGASLMTLSPGGALEFQRPTDRIEQEIQGGAMLHLKNRGVDALVTRDHTMIARPLVGSGDKEKPWSRMPAVELGVVASTRTKRVRLPCGGTWEGEELETFSIPAGDPKRKSHVDHGEMLVDMDTFLRFLGYFVSEGATAETTRGSISFSQNVGAVADDIIGTIEDLGFHPNLNTYQNEQSLAVMVGFSHIGFWSWLREHCGTRSGTKKIPRFVFALSRRQQQILFDAVIAGDGSENPRGSDGSFWYNTTSKQLDDDLCELALRVGVSWYSRFRQSRNPAHANSWAAYGHQVDTRGLVPETQMREVSYSGRVVCFTVPNHSLVTRRNGRVLVSGNCQYQCDTEAMQGEIFQWDHCQMIEDDAIPKGLRIFQGIDLAISEAEKNDLFADVTIGLDKLDNCYVLDYFDGHLRFGAQTTNIKRLYKQFDPIRAGIETNAYQAAQYQTLKDGDRDIRLTPLHTDKDKITRAWKLSPRFEDGRMFFRKGGNIGRLLDQLVLFPNYRYKDGFDALDLAIRASKMRKRKRSRRSEPGLI